jgi:hypothetical protein
MCGFASEERPRETTVIQTKWVTKVKELTRFAANTTQDFRSDGERVRKGSMPCHGQTVAPCPPLPEPITWLLAQSSPRHASRVHCVDLRSPMTTACCVKSPTQTLVVPDDLGALLELRISAQTHAPIVYVREANCTEIVAPGTCECPWAWRGLSDSRRSPTRFPPSDTWPV